MPKVYKTTVILVICVIGMIWFSTLLTAVDIISFLGIKKLTPTTTNTIEDASAGVETDIDMLICDASNVELVGEEFLINKK